MAMGFFVPILSITENIKIKEDFPILATSKNIIFVI